MKQLHRAAVAGLTAATEGVDRAGNLDERRRQQHAATRAAPAVSSVTCGTAVLVDAAHDRQLAAVSAAVVAGSAARRRAIPAATPAGLWTGARRPVLTVRSGDPVHAAGVDATFDANRFRGRQGDQATATTTRSTAAATTASAPDVGTHAGAPRLSLAATASAGAAARRAAMHRVVGRLVTVAARYEVAAVRAVASAPALATVLTTPPSDATTLARHTAAPSVLTTAGAARPTGSPAAAAARVGRLRPRRPGPSVADALAARAPEPTTGAETATRTAATASATAMSGALCVDEPPDEYTSCLKPEGAARLASIVRADHHVADHRCHRRGQLQRTADAAHDPQRLASVVGVTVRVVRTRRARRRARTVGAGRRPERVETLDACGTAANGRGVDVGWRAAFRVARGDGVGQRPGPVRCKVRHRADVERRRGVRLVQPYLQRASGQHCDEYEAHGVSVEARLTTAIDASRCPRW